MTLSRDTARGTLAAMPPPKRTPSDKPEALALDEAARQLARTAERYKAQLAALKTRAVAAVRAGVPKVEVARRAGYTTKQLDRWLADADD